MKFTDRNRQHFYPVTGTLNNVEIKVGTNNSTSPETLGLGVAAHYGLPMIGFTAHNYQRTSVGSQYGGVIGLKFNRLVPGP